MSNDHPALDALITQMEALLVPLRAHGDPRRYFHATYLRTTVAVRAELAADGFLDAAWVERWGAVFADLYLDAMEAYERGGHLPGPWAVAFAADGRPSRPLPPLVRVLLGMNAHINYDLPLALLAVISDAEFGDAALLDRRAADHRHIDHVLVARIAAERQHLRAPGGRRARPGEPRDLVNLAAGRVLAEARTKVWANTRVLALARSHGEAAYAAGRAELERLATARATDLTKCGRLPLQLAARRFGIDLSPDLGTPGLARRAQGRAGTVATALVVHPQGGS